MSSIRLVLFTRYPTPGQAKTRLIPALGANGAAELHRRLTEATLATLLATGLPVELWVTSAEVAAFEAWLGKTTPIRPQEAQDLGARMNRALQATPAILVGSDLPTLTASHIAHAAALLADGKVALGPAEDGGYYLVGLPSPMPLLFEAMVWSGSDVLSATRHRLDTHSVPYALLPTLPYLDRPEDLARFPGLVA